MLDLLPYLAKAKYLPDLAPDQGDGDRARPDFLCCTDRARLAQLAAATLERTRRQLTFLVQQTGQNTWRFIP